ncbi:hypothetical protein PHMEG_00016305 [Phytophthora megakarya]|uniref:FYVE-type domain-containing protein n=1 Tax=Phytophthora megakarya TaxID=4795 RepID=A0A225VZ44_9STRA|nr:hypothetical protein PHMEG_00016305 [Phytophthora megakarya]
MMSATAFAAGTISEALEALASPVTEDYRRTMRFLHGPRFVDGVCLHTIAGVTPRNGLNSTKHNSQAFTTVKWAAFDDGKALNAAGSPTGTDYCFLEHSGIHRNDPSKGANDSESEVFGFSIQESITREGEVPSLGGVGLARGHLHRTGILILPTDRSDVVQVTSILQMRIAEGTTLGAASDGNGAVANSGKAGALSLARRMRHRVAAIGRLDLLLERRRLNKLQHMPRDDWVADDARKACAVCVKPFALRRRKHHCRHCGEVVCASCAPVREVDMDNKTTTNARICTACVVQSRTGSQAPGGYDIFVYHVRDTGSFPSTPLSPISPINPANNTDETRPKSLSSGSSTFSISSDSQMSARLTRAGYADGAVRLYDYEDDHLDASSSSSSSYSLSEFDSFDDLVAIPLSNQDDTDLVSRRSSQRRGSDLVSRRSSQRRGSGQPAIGSSPESTGDLLERIRGMKADLSTLTTTYRNFSDGSNFSVSSSTTNSLIDDGLVVPLTPRPAIEAERTSSSDIDDSEDSMVDFINNSDQFTLLCPETLSRQWRTRTSSRVRQDAGEKSHLSASMSNISNMSFLSNSTMLGDDEDLEQREELEGRSESQAELQALRQQVEGLHRSLAATTSQLDSFHTRRVSHRLVPTPVDPVAARHLVTYGLLVEELHEIMGLPRPGPLQLKWVHFAFQDVMRTTAALCAALVAVPCASSLRVVSSLCDEIGEHPVHVEGVSGVFCVPGRPCEGPVDSAAHEPLAGRERHADMRVGGSGDVSPDSRVERRTEEDEDVADE